MTLTGFAPSIIHVLIVDGKAYGRAYRADKNGEIRFTPPRGNKWEFMPVYGPKDVHKK